MTTSRPSAHQRGYNARWRKVRDGYLRKNPLCVDCEKRGKVIPAVVLDHIIPHKGDQALFWDSDNWQGLCTVCHNRKTATEDGGFGNKGGKVKPAGAECGLDGMPTDKRHHWHK